MTTESKLGRWLARILEESGVDASGAHELEASAGVLHEFVLHGGEILPDQKDSMTVEAALLRALGRDGAVSDDRLKVLRRVAVEHESMPGHSYKSKG